MIEATLVGDVPGIVARRWPRRTALQFGREKTDYGSLATRITFFRSRFLAAGLSIGDRVAVYMENRPEYLYSYFGVPGAGGTLVPLNTFLAPAELKGILVDCAPRGLIVSSSSIGKLAGQLNEVKSLEWIMFCGDVSPSDKAKLPDGLQVHTINNDPEPAAAGRQSEVAKPDNTAFLIYTSGTTGTPKGVMLTHTNVLSNAAACIDAAGLRRKDKVLVALPLFHSFTLMVGILAPVLGGVGIVLCERLDKAEVRTAITRCRPTIFPGVPPVFQAMAQAKISLLARLLNPVRLYISGGAPLSLETLAGFEQRYRRPLCEGYGLSEASPVVALNPPSGPRKPGSVGRALPGVDLRIVGPEGEELSEGKPGELLVRGESVMKGYLGAPEATSSVLKEGWLRTGDQAALDEEGYLFIRGRNKDMLIFRGMNIYPREIEEVLETHPSVLEAVVVGMPDEKRGEVPFAFVTLKGDLPGGENELKRLCLDRLARYKIPRNFTVLTDMPRNPAGKVLKDDLKTRVTPQGASSSVRRLSRQQPPESGNA